MRTFTDSTFSPLFTALCYNSIVVRPSTCLERDGNKVVLVGGASSCTGVWSRTPAEVSATFVTSQLQVSRGVVFFKGTSFRQEGYTVHILCTIILSFTLYCLEILKSYFVAVPSAVDDAGFYPRRLTVSVHTCVCAHACVCTCVRGVTGLVFGLFSSPSAQCTWTILAANCKVYKAVNTERLCRHVRKNTLTVSTVSPEKSHV